MSESLPFAPQALDSDTGAVVTDTPPVMSAINADTESAGVLSNSAGGGVHSTLFSETDETPAPETASPSFSPSKQHLKSPILLPRPAKRSNSSNLPLSCSMPMQKRTSPPGSSGSGFGSKLRPSGRFVPSWANRKGKGRAEGARSSGECSFPLAQHSTSSDSSHSDSSPHLAARSLSRESEPKLTVSARRALFAQMRSHSSAPSLQIDTPPESHYRGSLRDVRSSQDWDDSSSEGDSPVARDSVLSSSGSFRPPKFKARLPRRRKKGKKNVLDMKGNLWAEASVEGPIRGARGIREGLGDIFFVAKRLRHYDRNLQKISKKHCLAFGLAAAARELQKDELGDVMTDNQKLGHSFHYVTFLEACRLGSKEKALAHLQIYCKHELVHGCWDDTTLGDAPPHFVLLDKSNAEIVLVSSDPDEVADELSLTSTKSSGGIKQFSNGFADEEAIESMEQLIPIVQPVIQCLIQQNDSYSVRLCAWGRAAAVLSLLTLKWKEMRLARDIHCFTFGCPPVMSKALLASSTDIITSYTHHFAAGSRLSKVGLRDMSRAIHFFAANAGDRLKSMLDTLRNMNSGSSRQWMTGAFPRLVKTAAQLISDMKIWADSREQQIYPPGQTMHLWRCRQGAHHVFYRVHHVAHVHYSVLQFATSMVKDGKMSSYSHALRQFVGEKASIQHLFWRVCPASERFSVIGYWKQFPNVQKLDEDGIESIFNVNYSVVIDILNLPSLYKSKALRKGFIRPFLCLISMHPAHRARLGAALGIADLITKPWYGDVHREAWEILTRKHFGLIYRTRKEMDKMYSSSSEVSWKDTLVIVSRGLLNDVTEGRTPARNRYVERMEHLNWVESISACMDPDNKAIKTLEEIVIRCWMQWLPDRMRVSKLDPAAERLVSPGNSKFDNDPSLQDLCERLWEHGIMDTTVVITYSVLALNRLNFDTTWRNFASYGVSNDEDSSSSASDSAILASAVALMLEQRLLLACGGVSIEEHYCFAQTVHPTPRMMNIDIGNLHRQKRFPKLSSLINSHHR